MAMRSCRLYTFLSASISSMHEHSNLYVVQQYLDKGGCWKIYNTVLHICIQSNLLNAATCTTCNEILAQGSKKKLPLLYLADVICFAGVILLLLLLLLLLEHHVTGSTNQCLGSISLSTLCTLETLLIWLNNVLSYSARVSTSAWAESTHCCSLKTAL